MQFGFEIEKKLQDTLARAGTITTPHGSIQTPAVTVVGTKATVKALTPEQLNKIGVEAVLANTYHLYLQPGHELIKKSGGLGKFMNWNGPTLTDSGGFQAFSLGAAFGKKLGKIAKQNQGSDMPDSREESASQAKEEEGERMVHEETMPLAKITEEGVEFRSHIDGSKHFFTPERSIEIQHAIGADIIFAFDECTSPHASYEYQKEAMDRTHRWAKRSLKHHKKLHHISPLSNTRYLTTRGGQAMYGIVQGGRFEDLRKESASVIGAMDFDGFGIGGSFEKEDMEKAVRWVNERLPEEKPRHLLGIGEPADLFMAVENGCDTFDCVAPTRMARNGTLHTKTGRINILNARFMSDPAPIDEGCGCYTCNHYTRAYLAHLFRSKEMLAATLASIHNVYFIVHLAKKMRQTILDGDFANYRKSFLGEYYKKAE